MTEFRVTWQQTIGWEITVEAESMRDALNRAKAGEYFGDAHTIGEHDDFFQAEEIPAAALSRERPGG